MNDLESSVTYFHKAIEICPEDAYLWTQYGITLSRNNKHHEAIKIFQNALVLDPTYTISKWNLGLTYRSIGHYEDAVGAFNECLETEPNSEYFKDEIHYQLGLCYFDMGWTTEAISEFRKHTDIYPDDIFSHLSIGNCYFDLGWIDESVDRFRFIIDKTPGFIPAYNSLAISYAEKGWYDEALETLRTALEIDPDDESVKENIDYIQGLKDSEDGLKSFIMYLLLKSRLDHHSFSE